MSTDLPAEPAAVAMRDVALSVDRALDQLDQVEDMLSAILRNTRSQLRTIRNRALDDAAWQPPLLELVVSDPEWITLAAAALLANRSYRTIKRWVQTGRLQAHNGQTKPEWVEQAIQAKAAPR